jgi:hypothetical protein
MKYTEFNEIEATWFNIEENTKKKCIKNNIDYWDYTGSFIRFKLLNYIKNKAIIKNIKHLDFNDEIGTRAALNKRYFSDKNKELELAVNNFNESKIELFNWLDKTKDPYFFILNPVYEYGSGISYKNYVNKRFGYIKVAHTGLENLDIAIEYLKYKNGIVNIS